MALPRDPLTDIFDVEWQHVTERLGHYTVYDPARFKTSQGRTMTLFETAESAIDAALQVVTDLKVKDPQLESYRSRGWDARSLEEPTEDITTVIGLLNSRSDDVVVLHLFQGADDFLTVRVVRRPVTR